MSPIGGIAIAGTVRNNARRRTVGGRAAVADTVIVRSRRVGIKRVNHRGGFADEIIIGICARAGDIVVVPEPLVINAPDAVRSPDSVGIGHEGHVESVGAVHVMQKVLGVLDTLGRRLSARGPDLGRPEQFHRVIHFHLIRAPVVVVTVHGRIVGIGLGEKVVHQGGPIPLHIRDHRGGGVRGFDIGEDAPVLLQFVLVEPKAAPGLVAVHESFGRRFDGRRSPEGLFHTEDLGRRPEFVIVAGPARFPGVPGGFGRTL